MRNARLATVFVWCCLLVLIPLNSAKAQLTFSGDVLIAKELADIKKASSVAGDKWKSQASVVTVKRVDLDGDGQMDYVLVYHTMSTPRQPAGAEGLSFVYIELLVREKSTFHSSTFQFDYPDRTLDKKPDIPEFQTIPVMRKTTFGHDVIIKTKFACGVLRWIEETRAPSFAEAACSLEARDYAIKQRLCWAMRGIWSGQGCNSPSADSDTPCANKSDCEGECQFVGPASDGGTNSVVGKCTAYKYPNLRCPSAIVRNGQKVPIPCN